MPQADTFPRLKLVIFLIVAFSGMGMSVILPILAPLIRELGLTESQGGWMVSVGSVVMAATGAMWGGLSDKWGRKAILLIGFGGLFATYIIYTLIVGFGLNGALSGGLLFASLLIGRSLVGAFLAAAPSSAQALMADTTTPETRSAGMSVISAASGVGLVVGPAIGGILALPGLIWPLVLTTVICATGLVLVWRLVPVTPPRLSHTDRPRLKPTHNGLWAWLLAAFFTMSSIVTVQISAGFYFQDKLGLSTHDTGPALAIGFTLVGVALIITQIIQMRLLRWRPRQMILGGATLWIIAMLILLNSQVAAGFYVAFALAGSGAGLLMPGFNAGASLSVSDEHQGAVAGFIAMMQASGAIVAPIGSTLLYEQGRSLPFWAIIGLMVTLGALFLLRNPVRAKAEP
ncbi:MAG: MFS transporter [Asticcacaulis sp.]